MNIEHTYVVDIMGALSFSLYMVLLVCLAVLLKRCKVGLALPILLVSLVVCEGLTFMLTRLGGQMGVGDEFFDPSPMWPLYTLGFLKCALLAIGIILTVVRVVKLGRSANM